MTSLRARIVLADCEVALADFNASVDANAPMRSRWVALIALLRAVGHVLQKADSPRADQEIQKRILAAWEQLGEETRPNIFHDFVEAERNDTLKLYEIGAAPNPKIHGAWTAQGAALYVSDVPGRVTLAALSMTDGPYKGRDPRQLAREAIEFWRNYLDTIELQPQSDRA